MRESESTTSDTPPEDNPSTSSSVRTSSSSPPHDGECFIPLPSFLFLLKPILVVVPSILLNTQLRPSKTRLSNAQIGSTHCSYSHRFEHPTTPIPEISKNSFLKPTTPHLSHSDEPIPQTHHSDEPILEISHLKPVEGRN